MSDDFASLGDILRRGAPRPGQPQPDRDQSTDWDLGPTEEPAGDSAAGGTPDGQATDPLEHDPTGLDLASQIAAAATGSAPNTRNKRKKRKDTTAGRSGAGDLTQLGTAVDGLIKRRGWQRDVSLQRLLSDWAGLVGAANGEHSAPEAYVNKVLTVRADSTAWATNLRLLAPQLVAKLNAALGEGTVVRVEVLGPTAPSWKHGVRTVRDGRGPRDTYG